VRFPQSRWLAPLAAVPPVLVTLASLGSLPVQAAGSGTAASSSAGAQSQRIELGVALVVLGLLILAVTVIRLKIQARQRQSPKLTGSRWAKVTDTWEPYSRPAVRRTHARSSW
jgi:hypothetical protein